MFNVIANKKGTNEWFVCETKGRVKANLLDELLQDEIFLHTNYKTLIFVNALNTPCKHEYTREIKSKAKFQR